jgi:hypothetical protein
MNNIVLYKVILAVSLSLITCRLAAQKPSIDLIPCSHQVLQTESMIDTSIATDSLLWQNGFSQPPAGQEENTSREKINKEPRRIGPSMDSLFRKSENRNAKTTKTTGNISLYLRKFNPVKVFISIIALK